MAVLIGRRSRMIRDTLGNDAFALGLGKLEAV